MNPWREVGGLGGKPRGDPIITAAKTKINSMRTPGPVADVVAFFAWRHRGSKAGVLPWPPDSLPCCLCEDGKWIVGKVGQCFVDRFAVLDRS